MNRPAASVPDIDLAAANDAIVAYGKHTGALAIVPIPDEVLGERLCCVVELVPGATLGLEELCDFLEREKLARRRWPERIEIVGTMPLTPTRKVIKGRLRVS